MPPPARKPGARMPIPPSRPYRIVRVKEVVQRDRVRFLDPDLLLQTAVAALCALLAVTACLGDLLPPAGWLHALVRGVTPSAACAFAGLAFGLGVAAHGRGPKAQQLASFVGIAVALLSLWSAPASLLVALGLFSGGLGLVHAPRRLQGVASTVLLRLAPALVLTVTGLLGIMSVVLERQAGGTGPGAPQLGLGPAAAFLALTATLLRQRDEDALNAVREDIRISLMSLAVLMAVVVVTGISTFWAVQARLHESEQERLVQSAYRREMAFNYQLANASRTAAALAQSPALARAMASSGTPEALAAAADELQATWRADFTAIRYEVAATKAPLLAQGVLLDSWTPGVLLEQADDMHFELQWNDGLLAYAEVPVKHEGRVLGRVVSQQRLPLMTEQLFETADLGQHVGVYLCTPASATQAWCFPSQQGGEPSMLPLRDAGETTSAIAEGIRGDQGVRMTSDANGTPVIDVFASVQQPLGLLLRQSADAVTAPVRAKLRQVFVVIGAMLLAGLVILNLQVRPLALRLVLNERRLSTVMGSVSDGIITTDSDGGITYLNRAAEAMTGWSLAEAKGRHVDEVYHVVPADTGQPADRDLVVRGDGARLPVAGTVSLVHDRDQAVVGTVLVFHNASAARARAAAITHEASHDALTGLINRKEFERRLTPLLAAERRTGAAPRHSLLYIDLDRFKQVNDTAGHAAGDELLRLVTRLMSGALRTTDHFARVGGDEFAISLPGCASHDAGRIADEVRAAVQSFEFEWEGAVFQVGTSIGVVTFEPGAGDLASVVSTADAACYRAKRAGRNNVQAHEGVLAPIA